MSSEEEYARNHSAFPYFLKTIEEGDICLNHPDENHPDDWLRDWDLFLAGWQANMEYLCDEKLKEIRKS